MKIVLHLNDYKKGVTMLPFIAVESRAWRKFDREMTKKLAALRKSRAKLANFLR